MPGSPEAVSITLPSSSCVFRKGSVVSNAAFAFRGDGAIEIPWGNPKRAVPRVTTFELSTRSSTGTRIGEGVGAAVRAAASAGDSILEPTSQPPTRAIATRARTPTRTMIRFLRMIDLDSVVLLGGPRISQRGARAATMKRAACQGGGASIDFTGEQLPLYALLD
jgi:hypothetical protein